MALPGAALEKRHIAPIYKELHAFFTFQDTPAKSIIDKIILDHQEKIGGGLEATMGSPGEKRDTTQENQSPP